MLYIFSILYLLNSLLVLYIYVSVETALSQTYVANYLYYAVCFKVYNANCAVTIGLANKTRAWTIDLFSVRILETR